MAGGWNSVPQNQDASTRDLQESQGITRFYGKHGWVHINAGFMRQGNVVARSGETSVRVVFNEAFPKQCFGVHITPSVSEYTLFGAEGVEGFTVPMSGGNIQFYWTAEGI
jgi:ribosomal protein L35AE/L33A